jgi:hypothetical protein
MAFSFQRGGWFLDRADLAAMELLRRSGFYGAAGESRRDKGSGLPAAVLPDGALTSQPLLSHPHTHPAGRGGASKLFRGGF